MSQTPATKPRTLLHLTVPSRAWAIACLAILVAATIMVGLYPRSFSGEFILWSLLFCWMALPGNLLCNFGIQSNSMPDWGSLVPSLIFWPVFALYWIGAIMLAIRFVRTRRLVFLMALGVILMLSAHGCLQHTRM